MIAAALLSALLIGDQPVEVIDGDTIRIGTEVVRIIGYDTPETHKAHAGCAAEIAAGKRAAFVLLNVLETAEVIDVDRKGLNRWQNRTLAVVYVDGHDLADVMIATGFARPLGRQKRRPWAICNSIRK